MTHPTRPAVKDEDRAHPVATSWRPTFHEIADAFASGDFRLAKGIASVAPVAATLATRIRDSVAAYGETLAALPVKTWRSSVAQWTGTHWDVLVDLWTVESGESDLVLHARVFETDGGGYWIEVDSIHVP